MQPATNPPESEQMLLQRALALAGFSLGQLAENAHIQIPKNFKREKGWTGQLIELYLGATAGSKPTQDFPELGIELKTIPIDNAGSPLETTYVCMLPLTSKFGETWQNSSVKNKLNRVLWVPIQGERNIAPADRRIGTALLWSPNEEQQQILKYDWEEHMEKVALGRVDELSAHQGEALQVRPKAANAAARTSGIGQQGEKIATLPRGFYLRTSFTKQILQSLLTPN